MLKFEEATDDTVASASVDDGPDRVDESASEPTDLTEPTALPESATGASARMLEVAAVTADRLVTDAETEAESLISNARAQADAILEASRAEEIRVRAELGRDREAQTAELDRERATAMAGLADEKAGLEAQIATLTQLQSDHRDQMRLHLAEQLTLLDAAVPEAPAGA
jgi:cell division septum initiation protein DivIVA